MSVSSAIKRATFAEFDKVLGLGLIKEKSDDVPEGIKVLIAKRESLRKGKKWAEADKVRIELESQGYKVEDTAKGSRVKK